MGSRATVTLDVASLLRRTFQGDRVALARAISWVENESAPAAQVLDAAFARAGRARRLGITGPPGAGKSTLVTRIAQAYRRRGQTLAIVAVDPTSPFSGGALLGDRVRMGELAGDDGVFIRSMATRGSLGGVAVHTAQVCDVLDAAGYDRVVVETVGVGQSELEIAQTADSTAVVLVPESGDSIQAMKAGLMEIGDLFVINKADRDGAERGAMAVRTALELRASPGDWSPPVLMTVASQGRGVEEVVDAFESHLDHLERAGGLEARRRQRTEQLLRDVLRDRLWSEFRDRLAEQAWHRAVDALAARTITPRQAADRLARAAGGDARSAPRPSRASAR